MFMLLDKRLRLPKRLCAQADILRERDLRLHPEFGFPFGMIDMHMQPGLFTREEKETKPVRAENGRCHAAMIAPVNRLAELPALTAWAQNTCPPYDCFPAQSLANCHPTLPLLDPR